MGKAKNLKDRVSSYFADYNDIGEKTKLLVKKISSIKYILVSSEVESLLLEANFIKKYNPVFNVSLKDGKAYPLIRITIKDKYPKVLVARRTNNKKSIYFGPFPNASKVKLVLKTVRRIFPYQAVLNHGNRICLYYHLGLCPCPTVFDSEQTKRQYRKNIRRIVNFLKGKIKEVINDLEKERNVETNLEHFEEAQKIQKKIDAIGFITQPITSAFEYETNPNLYEDLLKKGINELAFQLQSNGVNVNVLNRIECFDISNIAGKEGAGSMVVFTNGEKDTRWYKRFKIRADSKPNDFLMMQEVVQRRMKHGEWPYPDLLVVDGGKGQITAARKVLFEYLLHIPVVGLAKREEVIITQDFKEIRLPKDSKALQLIMRIRDEAHRFAVIYHRKLRSKHLIP